MLSSISSNIFSKGMGNFLSDEDVIVIDINKFKEEGRIKTVSVDSFETNNLVLVDERHRGMTKSAPKKRGRKRRTTPCGHVTSRSALII